MRRRLLDLCLLAYPRARRERDHDYLRDLALDLSETYGLRRQAMSLVRGGLGERIERHPMRRARRPRVWMRRLVVGCLVVAAMAFAASGLTGIAAGDGERVEVGRLVCVDTGSSRSNEEDGDVDGPNGCAQAQRLVASFRRDGWDCATRSRTLDGQRAIAWRCTL
jgi:hypothetical protein